MNKKCPSASFFTPKTNRRSMKENFNHPVQHQNRVFFKTVVFILFLNLTAWMMYACASQGMLPEPLVQQEAAPSPELQPAPLPEQLAEVIVEPVIETPVAPVAEVIAEPVVEPLVEAPAEPVLETIAEPVIETPVEPVAEVIIEPVVEVIVEPVVEAPVVTRPPLVVRSPQVTVFNGEPQPFSINYGGNIELVYFPSVITRREGSGGSLMAPVQAGDYYIRLRRYNENRDDIIEEIFAELRILKRPVRIITAAFQEAFFDGNPKRIEARAEPELQIFVTYYPNPELRETAVRAASSAAEENNPAGNPVPSISQTARGVRRVPVAPTERGTYYVWVFFPGDENHESAQAFVEFTIRPPVR
jgi:hypothetical protein